MAWLKNLSADKSGGKSFPRALAHIGASVATQALPSFPPSKDLLVGGRTPVPAMAPSATHLTPLSPSSNTTPNRNSAVVPARIFAHDVLLPAIEYKLPKVDEPLADTRQLAYCLSVLQTSPLRDDILDSPTRAWLNVMKDNTDEQERLRTMATEMIRALAQDKVKDAKAIAEVVCLAPVLEKDDFRTLLSQLVNCIKNSALLEVHALEGLAQLIQSAASGFIDADDLVKILELLSIRQQSTHQQSPGHIYQLTLTVSHILDAMADSDVIGLDRVDLHEPLKIYLQGLKNNSDPYVVFQAAYAHQALLYVPDNEALWHAAARRVAGVVTGILGFGIAVKTLDVNGLIRGLEAMQGGMNAAAQGFDIVNDAYKRVTALIESGQGLRESLEKGFSFSRKRSWYPALRGIDNLLQNGELTKFKTLVCEAPCRRDLAFQWGVCQRLGDLAADPLWDVESREGAVAFLGEIYRNDAIWDHTVQVKQCILDILFQLASTSDIEMNVKALLDKLKNDGKEEKQALYKACQEAGPSSHPLKVALPLLAPMSSLLDRIQNKPSVEPKVRKLRQQRLQDRGDAIYIPPQAKAHRQAPDDRLLDLTEEVKKFLNSDKKVLLLLGDSGAGKSTFNRELECELWHAYEKYEGRIPVFVALPGIDKPEHDLVAKQLRKAAFTEAQIQELKAHRRIILICDGYDECQLTDNLYTRNRLNQPGEWNVQMVISCRSEYLSLSGYDIRFLPGDHNVRTARALLQEVVIVPFSMGKIREYIEKYVAAKGSSWEIEDFLQAIDRFPGLQELVKNPLLLSLSLDALPHMTDPEQNLSAAKITRIALYDNFIMEWVERGERRLTERGLSGDENDAYKMLLHEGFSQNAIQFVKGLATAIFDNQDGNQVVEYSPSRKESVWKDEFFGHYKDKALLREVCPLRRSGNEHQFIHRSVLEYGLARAVFEWQSRGENWTSGMETKTPTRQQSENQGVEQEVSVTSKSVSDLASPLARRSFVSEPSILQFLEEHVLREPVFKQQLLDYIEFSKEDEKWGTAAANAITILIRAGVPFNSANLRGIQIPGADLSGGQFDYAQLQGANLEKANLRNIWLRQANLSNAKMADVQFGEWPYLLEDGIVYSCAYSPDGNTFVVSSGKTVSVYDISTWTKRHTLRGHTSLVKTVVYSPSSQQIASGSRDKMVRLWDAQTGAPGRVLRGHTDAVNCVVYSPSGQQIASGSYDKTVRLWDVQTGAAGRVLSGHTSDVRSLVYLHSGQNIASGSDDKTVRLWDVQTGALCSMLNGHTEAVNSVAYSPSEEQIASGSDDKTVRLWDAQTGAPGPILSGHTDIVETVVYSPRGQQIASGSLDKTVRLWDTQTGAAGPILRGHTAIVETVVYSRSGQQIASGSRDKTVRLWDTQTGAADPILSGHTDVIEAVVCSPSGQQIASGSLDNTVRLWDAKTGAPGPILSGHTDIVTSVAYSPNGQQIASGSHDKTVRLWDAETGAVGPILSGHTSLVVTVVYSPSGQQIASGSYDKTVQLWDTQTGARGPTLSGHTGIVLSVAYSPSGQQIASGSRDMTVRLWDVQTGTAGPILSGHTDMVKTVVYSPSGQQIASGSWDKTVRLWDAQTGAAGPILSGHTGDVYTVVYSASGQQIASGSWDKTVRLWEAQTGDAGPILSGHISDIFSVVYSSSGQQIASGSRDKTVRLWDVNSGQCLAVVKDFHGAITSIAWDTTPNGTYFVTGCEDNSVRLWHVMEVDDHYQVHRHWNTVPDRLAVSNTYIQNTRGLSAINMRLLEQRGAVSS